MLVISDKLIWFFFQINLITRSKRKVGHTGNARARSKAVPLQNGNVSGERMYLVIVLSKSRSNNLWNRLCTQYIQYLFETMSPRYFGQFLDSFYPGLYRRFGGNPLSLFVGQRVVLFDAQSTCGGGAKKHTNINTTPSLLRSVSVTRQQQQRLSGWPLTGDRGQKLPRFVVAPLFSRKKCFSFSSILVSLLLLMLAESVYDRRAMCVRCCCCCCGCCFSRPPGALRFTERHGTWRTAGTVKTRADGLCDRILCERQGNPVRIYSIDDGWRSIRNDHSDGSRPKTIFFSEANS